MLCGPKELAGETQAEATGGWRRTEDGEAQWRQFLSSHGRARHFAKHQGREESQGEPEEAERVKGQMEEMERDSLGTSPGGWRPQGAARRVGTIPSCPGQGEVSV